MAYQASDLKKGLKIEMDGYPYLITEFDFCKPGKGQAIYRCKCRNMITGGTTDKAFRSVDTIGTPDLVERTVNFSYDEGDGVYIFLDSNNEEVRVDEAVLGNSKYFLEDDMECQVLFFNGKPIEVTLPIFVEKVIAETEPGVRGDTATNVTKPARIENGYEISVPIFVNAGDLVRIDTRTGEYAERVKKGSL